MTFPLQPDARVIRAAAPRPFVPPRLRLAAPPLAARA
ncbi:UNVERIFIED_ORG: hypothetical protein J2W74_005043 [Methylorubrum zatmanii]